jgi:hypothetical protein
MKHTVKSQPFRSGETLQAMMTLVRALLASGTFAALAAVAAPAAAAPCSKETLTVRGTPVTIQYCIAGEPQTSGGATVVSVAATYSAAGGSFDRTSTMRFISVEGPARVLESVDLDQLGLTGTLHLTLAYAAGQVRIASALLTPGAVIVK